MTTRERNLLAVVGIVMILGLGFNILMNQSTDTENAGINVFAYEEASRLIKSSLNLENRNKVVAERLDALETRFFSLEAPDQALNQLLQEVERIAAESRLMIEQKSQHRFPDNLIGIRLAGKSSPDSVYLFLQKTTESKIGMKINKLQLHCIEEQRLLDFQIVVVSLLIEKRKKQ
ncbi:MAG: hypothetical protein K6U80_07440 [Firmicutes bacterium]|nr:hypothetical protein [Bacillota bacterium]